MREKCPKNVSIQPIHVKGHQDLNGNFDYDLATQSVKQNIDMDEMSKIFLKSYQESLHPTSHQLPLPGQKASIWIGNTPISNNIQHHVSLHFFGHQLEQRFLQQTDIPQEFQQIIQWKAFERAYRKTSDQDKLNTFNIISQQMDNKHDTSSMGWRKRPTLSTL